MLGQVRRRDPLPQLLDLAVQNTNVKAKNLLKGDLQRQMSLLTSRLRKAIDGANSRPAATPAEVARIKSLNEFLTALQEMYPVLANHIESSSKEVKAAEEKKTTEPGGQGR